jgi:D-alanyl-D-alanine carboxypeptidase
MFKKLKDIVNITGLNIIDRTTEAITILYQQITNDANTNKNTIISAISNQINEMSTNLGSQFNMTRINFQTMDANDRLIRQSNHEIITYIQTQTPILD